MSTGSTLEDTGDNIAQGFVAILTADGANSPLPAFGPRSTGKMPINRVEVRGGGFYRASDQMNYNPNAAPYYNHRRGYLVATVVTQRQAQTSLGKDSRHGIMIGRIRWLLSRIAQKMVPAAVGSLEIVDLIDLGDSYQYEKDTDTDQSELRFQIDLVIPSPNYVEG